MPSSHDGAVILNLLVAGILTLIIGAIALVLLQRAILRNMTVTSGQRRDPAEEPPRACGVRP